jgi:hypothetical protein
MLGSLRVLVMTLGGTDMVSFLESSPPSQSITDARSLIEHAEEWKVLPPPERAVAVVVMATGHRTRLIPFAGCTGSAQAAWALTSCVFGLMGPALLLPEGPAGAIIL